MLCAMTTFAVLLGIVVRPVLQHHQAKEALKTHGVGRDFVPLTEFHKSGVRHHYWTLVEKVLGPDAILSPRVVTISDLDVTLGQLRAIANLVTIEELTADNTRATDTFVRHLRTMQNLRLLYLNNTDISDAAVDTMESFPSLEQVSICKTNVTKDRRQKFVESTDLYVRWSPRISATDANAIRECVRSKVFLVTFDADFVECLPREHEGPIDLQPLVPIESAVRLVFIEQPEPNWSDGMKRMSNIQGVAIHGCKWRNVDWIGQLPNLKDLLVMRSPKIGDGFPELRNLERIFIHNSRFTDDDVHQIPAGSKIRSLCLDRTSVSDACCERIGTFRDLENLGLRGQPRISNVGVEKLNGLTRLNSLELNSMQITSVEPIQGVLLDIEAVDLSDTSIDDSAMDYLVGAKKLTYLGLDNTNVSPKALQRIAEIESLKRFKIHGKIIERDSVEFTEILDGADAQ